MAGKLSDVANHGIRYFLHKVGNYYDQKRGYSSPYERTKKNKQRLLSEFANRCCYCGKKISLKTVNVDHLIASNKESLGLTAWGNMVPCCQKCNRKKAQKDWELYLAMPIGASAEVKARNREIIKRYVAKMKYRPALSRLKPIVQALYTEIRSAASKRVESRFREYTRNYASKMD